ncbi:MAG: hypothetical protein JWP25_4257 [Bradyrhizobium sp.]|jgi:hypothetical protein|nr:hypothetical protein [Bradyrhizobium sp.]MEA2869396.1 hypothetical protein [Bradyrhizobium sp.]
MSDVSLGGIDTDQSVKAQATEAIQSASHRVSDAIEAGREPGMPLDILSRLVREAPCIPWRLLSYLAWPLRGDDSASQL